MAIELKAIHISDCFITFDHVERVAVVTRLDGPEGFGRKDLATNSQLAKHCLGDVKAHLVETGRRVLEGDLLVFVVIGPGEVDLADALCCVTTMDFTKHTDL